MSRYRQVLPDVSSKYGAPMGRRDFRGDPDYEYHIHLTRVRLDSGGYDSGGAYWGHGQPLYMAEAGPNGTDEVAELRVFLRASSRLEAKRLVQIDYPKASLYR